MTTRGRSPTRSAYAKLRQGYIALVSVIVLGAIGLAVASSLLLLGLGTSQASLLTIQNTEAKAMSDYCVEIALLNLHSNLNYYGGETYTYLDTTCTVIGALGKGNRGRIIEVTGTSGTSVSKVKVQLSRVRPQIVLTSWQEVADF